MKIFFLVVIVAVLAWKFSPGFQSWAEAQLSSFQGVSRPVTASQPVSVPVKCDGRKHCSQMTSCEEAKRFLQNCPGVEMDGDNDGVPCETQWCR